MKKNTIKIISGFLWVLFILNVSPVMAEKSLVSNKNSVKMLSPLRVAMLPGGDLLVSDHRLRSILTLNKKSLKIISSFKIEGKPLGVAYSKGFVYVGNTKTGRIEVYTRAGKLMRKIGSRMSIKRPSDIAIDEKEKKLFVVDGDNKAVKVYSLDGKFLLSIPGPANGAGSLTNPTGIALDTVNKEIFVSDYGDYNYIKPSIQIFGYNGAFKDTISGKLGMMGLQFSRPQGLAVNKERKVFLLDCYSAEIMVFDRITKKKLKTFGGYGTEPGTMRLPLDLVIDPKTGDIFVTNNRMARIEIFKKGGVL